MAKRPKPTIDEKDRSRRRPMAEELKPLEPPSILKAFPLPEEGEVCEAGDVTAVSDDKRKPHPEGSFEHGEFSTTFHRVAGLVADLDARLQNIRNEAMLEFQRAIRSLGHLAPKSLEEGRAIAALVNDRLSKYGFRIQLEGKVGGYLYYDLAGDGSSQGFYLRVRNFPKTSLTQPGFANLTIIDAPSDRRRTSKPASRR